MKKYKFSGTQGSWPEMDKWTTNKRSVGTNILKEGLLLHQRYKPLPIQFSLSLQK